MYSEADRQVIDAVAAAVESQRNTMFVPNPATRYKPGGSTGNLAFNALHYEVRGRRLVVYVNEDIAPYVPYTNEPWISPRWHGKKNPNEGWWNRFAQELILRVTINLKGDIK